MEARGERRLLVAGDTLSVYPLDGDWSGLRREYWWRALTCWPLLRRPRTLLVGLGGGTQVHLLRALARPRAITVIERDPVILGVALDWFGLRAVGGVEYLVGDAGVVVPALARAGRRFDFVMEDAVYATAPAEARPLAAALVPLVAAGGLLVFNRHRRGEARRLARWLAPAFEAVAVRRVRREGENALVGCARPRRPGILPACLPPPAPPASATPSSKPTSSGPPTGAWPATSGPCSTR